MKRVAIVLGGADCWKRDLETAQTFDVEAEYYVVNDQIASFPDAVIACTLHPEKLDGWLDQRAEAGLSAPLECWVRKNDEVTHNVLQLQEWGGTSGLFAFQVARVYRYRQIIFCGVPMDESPNSFHKKIGGVAVYSRHQRVWSKERLQEIKLFARSMSGWTADLLGRPDAEWLGLGEIK